MICLTQLLVFTVFLFCQSLQMSTLKYQSRLGKHLSTAQRMKYKNTASERAVTLLCPQMEEKLIPAKCNALAFKINVFF